MGSAKTPGEIFKEARLKKGWTQVQVAQKAGLDDNTYAKIERGINKPSSGSIKKLVKTLDINSTEIPNLL